MIVNSIKLLVIIVAAFISDKVGRRPIILVAGVLCFIGLLVIGTLGSFPINDKIGAVLVRRYHQQANISLICFMTLDRFCSLAYGTWGTLVWLQWDLPTL